MDRLLSLSPIGLKYNLEIEGVVENTAQNIPD